MMAQNLSKEYILKKDISYREGGDRDAYQQERCKLDLKVPVEKKGFATVVWFHGGGLEGGEKFFPRGLEGEGLGVVTVNYRLSPRARFPAYIDDAAAAVAWTLRHIEEYGGDPCRVYVSGHSAGGYLTLMVGMAKEYLGKYGVDSDSLAGLIPISGQTNTHFTIRKELGLPEEFILADGNAPLNHVHQGMPPILLITGDRNLEMGARWEENAQLARLLRLSGVEDVTLYELQGFDHGEVGDHGPYLIPKWIRNHDSSLSADQ